MDLNFEMPKSKVYIQLDNSNRVIRCDGGYTTPTDLTDWIEIDEGYGDKYNLCQSHYFDKPLVNSDGTHNYIYENNAVREATDAEREAELATFPPIPPTVEDRVTTLEGTVTALEAQVDASDLTAIEMYEALLAQTDINDAQDLSILEIYETLGGM